MILCEINLGTWRYISNQDIILTDSTEPWDGYVAAFPRLQFGISTDWGGLVAKSYGGIALKTALFSAIPPLSAEIKLYHTATDYASRVLLFSGYAHRKSMAADITRYDLYPYPDTATVNAVAENDTLYNICDAAATTLSLTFDGSLAQSPSPTVKYTTSKGLLAKELGYMAAFYDHFVWIDNGTLKLIYNDTDNGTAEVPYVSEIKYHDLVPPYKVSESTLSQEITTSYTYGRTVSVSPTCTDTAATALDAITAIKSRIIMPWFDISCPLDELADVQFGQKITWSDPDSRTVDVLSSYPYTITGWLRVRKIAYGLDDGKLIISGEGGIS